MRSKRSWQIRCERPSKSARWRPNWMLRAEAASLMAILPRLVPSVMAGPAKPR